MENSKDNKAAAAPLLDCRVGRCCYGGLKPKSGCGSCGAWQVITSQTCGVNGLLHGGLAVCRHRSWSDNVCHYNYGCEHQKVPNA